MVCSSWVASMKAAETPLARRTSLDARGMPAGHSIMPCPFSFSQFAENVRLSNTLPLVHHDVA